MKTLNAKPGEVERQWVVIDAEGQILGRLATEVARRLRGKHKPIFTPHVDAGDFVIVVNAEKVRLTGNKLDDKIYYRHTGSPGGLKQETARQRLSGAHPERMVEDAVRGMLPKNRLGRDLYRKLKVYVGADHPHQGQTPQVITLGQSQG